MIQITFATGNTGKATSLRHHLQRHNVEAVIKQRPLDLIEPQADTAEEVARVKAKQAWDQLKQPVLVDDSSFHIAVLKGFPGPYIKQMLKTIGIEGILQLMEGRSDRAASFVSSLVYVDEDGAEHVFEDDPYTGTIAERISEREHPDAWSDLFKIFVPDGQTKPLSELTIDERHNVQPERVDSYAKFAHWMKSRGKKEPA